ncbi:zinc-ribbon and DUF3426 domain-containing protein [Candidatus Symbiobacter mobilis]|uniref:Thioredoxin-like protein n=1 Tax=Candidatus Symbiobacter mobilis CR TaxID=946483 RepID=U5NAJ9_9BURK|nr:zinc-ribbon and DUF3426 domain-containing protein [Candidatus Symbiobacter mobilis]AGX87224.1 thioredoxin-like protein [Candidatus Symbiobacter mobilis CR]
MGAVTRCPQCKTCFRVVPDQLRISEGWVRCGRCGEVFDGALHMLASQPDAPGGAYIEQQATLPARQMPAAGVQPMASHPFHASDPSLPSVPDAGAVIPGAEPALDVDWEPLPLDMDDDDPPPSFLQHRPSAKTWMYHVVWGLVSLLATGGLLAQGAYWERDNLASHWPASRTALRALCSVLACQIDAPRRIDAVVIESAAFMRTGGGDFHLGFTVRNTAATEVARTHIELTLTDHADTPVLRRVLTPQDMGATVAAMAAHAEWAVSLGLRVEPGVLDIPVSGYRLEAFYL